MTQTALRLVDKETMDKQKALDAALTQIERAFGKVRSCVWANVK